MNEYQMHLSLSSLSMPPSFPSTPSLLLKDSGGSKGTIQCWKPGKQVLASQMGDTALTDADDQNHMLPASQFLSDLALLLIFLSQRSLLYCVELRPETVWGGKKTDYF